MPAIPDIDETDAISEYLDRVYSPIAIEEGDAIKWPAKAMRTEMEERIRAAVSQLEEIGYPHKTAVQEVAAKLKDPDKARLEVVQAARIAIKRSEYVQERAKTPWWRRDPEGWWVLGLTLISFVIRGLIPQTVNRDPAVGMAFAAVFFLVALGSSIRVGWTRRPTQSAAYHFSLFVSSFLLGALYSVHSNPAVREFAAAPLCILSGMSLGLGIIALRFEKSRRNLGISLWERKA